MCALVACSLLLALRALAGSGPYLFVDDRWIARSTGLTRSVHQPSKLPQPVLDNKTFGVTQPFVTVLRDPDSGLFRIWYCRGSQLWQATSKDGVHWSDPRVAYARVRGYGAAIVDDRGRDPDAARRFKLADWESTPQYDDTEKDDGGMYIRFSPDNTNWTPMPGNPVLPSWPDGYGKYAVHGVSDIIDAFYDPIHQRYAAAVKLFSGLPEDPWSRGTRLGSSPGTRRIVGMTFSPDFEPAKERQIGLTRMPADRYVSRDADPNGGTLLTPPLALSDRKLIVNADIRGEMRVRLLRTKGEPVRGHDWDDCQPIKGDSVAHDVSWHDAREKLPSGAVGLEFKLVNAKLYGFGVK